jgi:CRP/FNR family transcriptional regulator, anaerobic regulatory protein
MSQLEEYIKSYFGVIANEDLKTIVSLFTQETINKNDCLVTAGKRCNKLSFIQSGLLRVFTNQGEKEVTQWISTAGYFSTDLSSFIFDTPARFTIEALVDTEIYSITKNDYSSINKTVAKWPELEKLFLIRCFTMLEDRIFTHLSMSAEERYQAFFKQNATLFNQVPLHYIASMLGMTAETFSRIRKNRQRLNS